MLECRRAATLHGASVLKMCRCTHCAIRLRPRGSVAKFRGTLYFRDKEWKGTTNFVIVLLVTSAVATLRSVFAGLSRTCRGFGRNHLVKYFEDVRFIKIIFCLGRLSTVVGSRCGYISFPGRAGDRKRFSRRSFEGASHY